MKYQTLEMLGYGKIYVVGDVSVIVTDPDIPPPQDLPPMEDGVLRHPCPRCYVSGNRFGIDYKGRPKPSHRGTDYGGGDGNAYAAHNGTVTVVGFDADGYGNYVILKSRLPGGTLFCSLYAHGRVNIRQVNDELRAGEVIFEMGNTGNSTGVHLHFELRIGGKGPYCGGAVYVDPEVVLP